MPTDYQDNFRPDPTPPDWLWALAPPTARKPDRATYEASRRAELSRIRRLDVAHRELLSSLLPFEIRGDDDRWDDEDISLDEKEEHHKAESELYLSRRVLVHAVEGYLLGCVAFPVLTGEGALRRATSTDGLSDLLQAEEDLMIRTFGQPRDGASIHLNKNPLHGLQHPGDTSTNA
jgi:hypothetical protein